MGPVRGKIRKRKRGDNKLTDEKKKNGCSNNKNPNALDWWHDFSRMLNEGQLTPSKSLDNFELVFRISRRTFSYICSLVTEDLTSKLRDFTFLDGRLLSLHDQVAVALRRLSTGDSLVAVADSFGVNHSTVSQVTWRFVESMEQRALRHLEWPSTEIEMAEMKSKFEKMQGLPNCCGVVDITHIRMLLSSSDSMADVWLDQEKNHSMVLQGIVGPDMRFLDIVTGWPGKMDESAVFESSTFRKLCDQGERLNGETWKLSEDGGSDIKEYIIGDSGYPLLPNLIVPYGKVISNPQEEFNRRHSGTCVVAPRAFARLKETWKIIGGRMWRPDRDRLPRFILVCCLLHNIAIDLDDKVQAELPLSCEHDLGYRQRSCGSMDIEGLEMRDKLAMYLSRGRPIQPDLSRGRPIQPDPSFC